MYTLEPDKIIDRAIFVFCNWLVFGLIGLGFTLEGGARADFLVGLIGIAGVVAGFAGHMVINQIYSTSFTLGEVTLGLVLFALGSVVFILLSAFGELSSVAFQIGLTLFAILVVGFFAYVATRYGVSGAFKKFDVIPTSGPGKRET
jgi:hypothetical protein